MVVFSTTVDPWLCVSIFRMDLPLSDIYLFRVQHGVNGFYFSFPKFHFVFLQGVLWEICSGFFIIYDRGCNSYYDVIVNSATTLRPRLNGSLFSLCSGRKILCSERKADCSCSFRSSQSRRTGYSWQVWAGNESSNFTKFHEKTRIFSHPGTLLKGEETPFSLEGRVGDEGA